MNFHYRDISKKNSKVTVQNSESLKTGSSLRSLKQFSFQSMPKSLQRLLRCQKPNLFIFYLSLPSARQHPSYDDCLEVKREYYQNSSVLHCVTQCSQSTAHLCEQFLEVKQIGFVTLGFGTLMLCIEAVA